MDLVTSVMAEIVTPSAIVMCPTIPTPPPIMQWLPIMVDPEMPTHPAMAVCAPMRLLWPTWTWLSILAPSPITVSPIAPRSTVVFAPISTSGPMTTRPTCGIFSQAPPSGAKPNPSAPMTLPECRMQRSPTTQWA